MARPFLKTLGTGTPIATKLAPLCFCYQNSKQLLQSVLRPESTPIPYKTATRSLFLCSFGRKLFQPKKSNILNNDCSAVLLGNHNQENINFINKQIWDSDFIEYQNTLQVETLKKLLVGVGVTDTKAQAIVHKYPVFNFTDSELIKDSFTYLQSKGVSVERILNMAWILALKTDVIKERAEKVMQDLNFATFDCAAPFLEIPAHRLHHISKLWKQELARLELQVDGGVYPNRLYLLASKLDCEPCLVADMMTKVPYLMSGSFSTSIGIKLEFLLGSGVKAYDIVRDPWVLTQNIDVIKERCELCVKLALTSIKPWMLRSTKKALNDYVERLNQEEELLAPHSDIKGFLKYNLNCDLNTVGHLLQRVPSLQSASASKLNAMIQYLYSCGFTSSHILKAPNVLAHSQATIEGRISELNSFGYKTDMLNILCQSSRRYKSFVQKLKTDDWQERSNENI